MRLFLLGLFAFAATLFVSEVAKAGDCRKAVVVQEVVQYQPVQQVVVQRQVSYAQPVVVQRQFVQSNYGYGQSQSFRQSQFVGGGRQRFVGGGGGGGGGLGSVLDRRGILTIAGAGLGAAAGGPLGAVIGAGLGNVIAGGN